MKLEQWSENVAEQIRAQGFDVEIHEGFPLVRDKGLTVNQRMRLLSMKLETPTERTVYQDGMLFMPMGSQAMVKRELAERDAVR